MSEKYIQYMARNPCLFILHKFVKKIYKSVLMNVLKTMFLNSMDACFGKFIVCIIYIPNVYSKFWSSTKYAHNVTIVGERKKQLKIYTSQYLYVNIAPFSWIL